MMGLGALPRREEQADARVQLVVSRVLGVVAALRLFEDDASAGSVMFRAGTCVANTLGSLIRSQEPLAVEVNHVVGRIGYPNLGLPRDVAEIFQ